MAEVTDATLKTYYENGDVPIESQYEDLIDTKANKVTVANVYNIASYGADATGVANSSTALQAAIDDAEAAGGGIVHVPVGEFRLNTGVTVDNDNVIIEGVGDASILKYYVVDGYAIILGKADFSARDLGLRRVTIDAQDLGGGCVWVRGGNNIATIVEENLLTNGSVMLLWGEQSDTGGAYDGSIFRNRIDVAEDMTGIRIEYNSSAVTISENWIRGWASPTDSGSVGVEIQNVSANVSIVNNNIEGLHTNLKTNATTANYALYVAGNYFETWTANGLSIDIDDIQESALIIGNYFSNSSHIVGYVADNAIRIRDGAQGISIISNTFLNHLGASVLNDTTSALDASIHLKWNIESDKGDIISSYNGVATSSNRNYPHIFAADKGTVFGGYSLSSDKQLGITESATRMASIGLADTDNTNYGTIGMANAADAIVTGTANLDVVINNSTTKAVLIGTNNTARLNVRGDGKIGVWNGNANVNTPGGATAYEWPIYDIAGNLLGYIPIYAAQW